MHKRKLFLILSDLDGTILPINTRQLRDFANILKNISDKKDVEIKFCPVSGRPSNYVLAVMDMFNTAFKEAGLANAVGYGASEQGSVILPGKERVYERISITKVNPGMFKTIEKEVLESEWGKYFCVEPDLKNSLTFVIKAEIPERTDCEKRKAIFKGLKEFIYSRHEGKVNVAYSGCLEVTPLDVSKDKAIRYIVDDYQKKYDIRGITYCGDSENDISALRYMSMLSIIPGQTINVFLPSNAMKSLRDGSIEKWKEKFEKHGVRRCTSISEYKNAEGVINLLKDKAENGNLLDDKRELKVRDDIGIRM